MVAAPANQWVPHPTRFSLCGDFDVWLCRADTSVRPASMPNGICHPERSEAQSRDLGHDCSMTRQCRAGGPDKRLACPVPPAFFAGRAGNFDVGLCRGGRIRPPCERSEHGCSPNKSMGAPILPDFRCVGTLMFGCVGADAFVRPASMPNGICHPERSEAQSRDLGHDCSMTRQCRAGGPDKRLGVPFFLRFLREGREF
jgi:hypothetical protein